VVDNFCRHCSLGLPNTSTFEGTRWKVGEGGIEEAPRLGESLLRALALASSIRVCAEAQREFFLSMTTVLVALAAPANARNVVDWQCGDNRVSVWRNARKRALISASTHAAVDDGGKALTTPGQRSPCRQQLDERAI
jgi:hypothetical protein